MVMATRYLKINLCGVKALLVSNGDKIKGRKYTAFVEIYCMVTVLFFTDKCTCDGLGGRCQKSS